MKNLGKVEISDDALSDVLILSQAKLHSIWKDEKYNRINHCIIESDIFKPISEGQEVPEYELIVEQDKVGNKIIKAE